MYRLTGIDKRRGFRRDDMRLLQRWALLLAVPLSLATGTLVPAATSFADPAFQQQWQQGESLTSNFWGPLANARDGQQEPYKEAPSGQRLVQYFDKGRMELTSGKVTNGLLASELFKEEIQTGDAATQFQPAPNTPIAGDPDNPGPTYAAIRIRASAIFFNSSATPGRLATASIDASGALAPGDPVPGSGPTSLGTYDNTTQHNVLQAFAAYRDRVGLQTIGYATSEPFSTNVKVGGTPRRVIVQIFERRVLTYTAENPPAFQVEMGNIGQHYYQWRYGPPFPTAASSPTPINLTLSPITLDYKNVGSHGAPAIISFTASASACLGYEVRRIGGPLPATDWMTRAPAHCTPSIAYIDNPIVDTGDKLEYRGFARDLAGNTVYTPNTVVADGTTPAS
jgi:hypothetical protein